ncbi:RING finger and CCCH-type zinc finger domain-containing protein roquin isoform X2 [Anticarsia gemmatalis]|uniref:RING finger and CCCH-type zinc finger domain-containing protein roquin isoform X2 n=1 Tax=Anticarsia gemmatalis TaxID=129554 RepID=UPI003F761139
MVIPPPLEVRTIVYVDGMPIQAPQWTDYLNCPVCCREFGAPPRSPISLGCGHTLCKHCLKHLHRKQCPFDQTAIQVEQEELVVNTALLQLAGYSPPAQPYHPPSIAALPEPDRQAYDLIVQCMEHLAVYLKYCGNVNNSMTGGSRLSRPMQRKLVMLLQCAITDEEGRGRAARAARSLGERTVTELILQHQQLSANLWAAVRARGCQFLGPAMQEEVLKLVLLALEDGSALSRKVLVMFVVQRLEPHFPQASKTSIGHVVQLLYRASCFKVFHCQVSKRECDSSLMQLKEEFRTYESLRREHDAQIVQIATEAGLRIAPDQWSALLYGDTAHKSHMQSIIDKLQTPQSFAQSVQELFIALQRTGDPAQLIVMSLHLDRLANIDASPDAKSPSWQQLSEIMTSLKDVVAGLIHYLQQQATGRDSNHNQKHNLPDRCIDNAANQGSPQTATTPTHAKYKVSMCRDAAARSFCPRGNACTFAHSEEELERFREYVGQVNGNYTYVPLHPNAVPLPGQAMPLPPQFPPYGVPAPMMEPHNFPVPPMPPNMGSEMGDNAHANNGHQAAGFSMPHHPIIMGQPMPHNDMLIPPGSERVYYPQYGRIADEHRANVPPFRPDICPPFVQNNVHMPAIYPAQEPNIPIEDIFNPVIPGDLMPDYRNPPPPFPNMRLDPRADAAVWAPNPGEMFNFNEMRSALPPAPHAEAFPQRPEYLPMSSRRSSPVEGAGPRAVGGPVSVPGPNGPSGPQGSSPVPSTSNGPLVTIVGDRKAVGANRVPIERSTVTERLAAAAQAYQITGPDDQELEEGLQALERRIDTEFKNAD